MNQQTCNPDLLDEFLQNELSDFDEQQFTRHLDDCADCREELESRAAERSAWQEASNMLGGTLPRSTAVIGHNRTETGRSPQIEQVLQQLAPTDDPAMLGRIGSYEVSGVVGAGGMGVVLKAHDRSLDRIVAIKVMSPHLASNGSARKRFAREAKAAAAVLHPNVIAIHGVASDDACPYLVMPYLRGASLQKRIDSQGPLPLKDTLRIGSQIAAGLAAAHEQGLVHRDIKPANILLEEGVERVTITDFGLARAVDDASMTCSGVIAGTPQYMSPEQTRGEPIDARSDLFSLGSVLYAMCTGRSPFRAETTYGVLHRIANDNLTPICEVNSDMPVWLSHIIERLMAKRPDGRFESAAQVAELLDGCLAHVQQPTMTSLPEELTAIATSDNSRHRTPICSRHFAFNVIRKGVIIMLGMTLLGMVIWQATDAPDISGEWKSNEWGTVVLEAREPGQYEGTFTGSDQDKPDYDISDIPDIPVDGADWFGHNQPKLTRIKFGTIQLKWSRVERRFNGTWRKGITRSGRMSLRLMDDEIRGAWTTNKDAQKDSDGPRLADLMWKRNTELSVTEVEDSQLADIAKLHVGSTTDEICSSTALPDPTRILIELEMQRDLKRNAICRIYDDQKDSFRIIVEPVYDRRVPVREYPIIGRASLHLLRYKCTVHYVPSEGIEWPLTKDGKPETEITLYVDSDHLHRAVGGKQAVSSQDEDAAVPGRSGRLAYKKVDFVLDESHFVNKDRIEIHSVMSSGNGFEVGATVTVTGAYTLESVDAADLCFYLTTTVKSGEKPKGKPIQPGQRVEATKGTSNFALSLVVEEIGRPHITFYHRTTGNPIGGVYFAERVEEASEFEGGETESQTAGRPSE